MLTVTKHINKKKKRVVSLAPTLIHLFRKYKAYKKWLLKNLQEKIFLSKKVINKKKTQFISYIQKVKSLLKQRLIRFRQWSEYLIAMNSFLLLTFLLFKINTLLQKFGIWLFSIFYFGFLIFAIHILNIYTNLTIEIGVARDFFIAAGAMVGGTLAIVVSFALFTVQQAAEQLPKDFYRLATNLKKYLIIFLADVLITLLLFCGALTYGQLKIGMSHFSIQIGLLFVGSSFYLILLLLNQVKNDVDKDKILLKVLKNLISTIQQVRTRTTKFAQLQLLHPSNRGKFTLEQVLARLYQSPQLQLQFDYLKRELDYLFDYHDYFVSNSQKRSALEVLEGIKAVVLNYLLSRKGSSIAFPEENSLMVLTSDSQYVLQPILERSISLGEGYMKREDTAGTMAIINVFIEWSKQAAQITYTGLITPENPILEQITGYFNQLMDRATKQNSLEGMYQGLRYYKAISVLCVEKSYIHILSSIIRKIEEVGYKGILSKQDPVLGEAFTTYSEILRAIFIFQPSLLDHYFLIFEKHLNNLVSYGYMYTSAGSLRDNLTAQQDVAKPHKTLLELIYKARAKVHESNNSEDKKVWQGVTLELVEHLRTSLRTLSEQMKNPNHILIHSYGQIIGKVGVLLVQLTTEPEWESNREPLLVEAQSYLHLPTWFLHDISNFESNLSFDSLIEAITHIGMASLTHENMDNISKDAINILASKAIEFLDKQKSRGAMYLEPEVMEHACYLGILALKMGKSSHVQALKEKIVDFEKKYLQKYFSKLPEGWSPYSVSPPADKLKKDIESLYQRRSYGWTDRFGMGMVEDIADELMNTVTTEDIRNFITAIWGEVIPFTF